MGRRPKQPNHVLAELIDEAGLTRKGLARRVVERGRVVGHQLSYDHNSVRRWLEGEQPRPPGPDLIAAVLSEALGRKTSPSHFGMHEGSQPVDLGLEFALSWGEGVSTATALWRGDVERRKVLAGAAYAVAGYSAASMRWLTLPGRDQPAASGRRKVGQADVEALRTMAATFRDLDNRVGGGRIRQTVVQYLHSEVSPLLRGDYTEQTGRLLFAAAAELTKLAGWMAYDDEEHGLAQRYLIQALRMSRTASDHALGAEILAAMSHQATYIGRPGDAVDLARAAQIGARKAGLAVLESECHIVEAHGHAAREDASACSGSLAAAETAFERTEGTPPEWLAYFDEAYLSAKFAHCFRALEDDRRSGDYAEQSLNMTDGYLRGRAFNLCLLASARAADDPLEAVRVGDDALTIAEGLSSKRSRSYLRDLRHRLTPHGRLTEVAEFRNRVAAVTAQA